MKIRKKDSKAAVQTSSLPKHILVSKQTLLQCIGLHAHCTAFEFQQVGFSRLAAGFIVLHWVSAGWQQDILGIVL